MVKNPPANSGDVGARVQPLSREDPLEKEMAIYSSTFAWKIPWMEEPVGYSPWGLQRVGHD